MPPLTLLMSTPDGIPERLLDLWDRTLCSIIKVSDTGATDSERRIAGLHRRILEERKKTWYQLCRHGFKLEEKSYQETLAAFTPLPAGDRPLAIADPLLCFLAPLWREPANTGICVFYYSDPMDAATELQNRWNFPLGFGLALWEYYVIHALDQLREHPHLLFSATQFMASPDTYLLDFSARYRELAGVQSQSTRDLPVLQSEWHSESPKPNPERYVSKAQRSLFDALESGHPEQVYGTHLSDPAEDLLVHYGDLRSEYEYLKQRVETLDPRTTTPLESADSTSSDLNANGQHLLEVTVHVDGMPPMEFQSAPDSPAIEMLNNALSQKGGQLVYLLSDDPTEGAIYFASDDLRAIETNLSET